MCELCLPRRAMLAGAGGLVLGSRMGWRPASAAPAQAAAQPIVARAEWGPDLPALGPVPDEPDVRFLLVHHTVNANDYADVDVVGLLAAIYRFHTSAERGWPDIAYNFLVDRFGTIYEGRTGSLAGPKAGDATGGSQGFAQLCAFVGDHRSEAPSEAAVASMGWLLAFLGDRHALDLSPGATATFVSRGSNRRPAGEEVTTLTISGHRDMSSTVCPGDVAYAMVTDGSFARLAAATRAQPATTTTGPPPPTTTTTAVPTPTTSPASSTSIPTPGTTAVAPPDDNGSLPAAPVAVVAAAAVGAVLALRNRRRAP